MGNAASKRSPKKEWPAHLGLAGLCIAAVVLMHAPLLTLPYYWDEAGYYIPAARDFYLSGSLVAHSTVSNPHPPLLSVYLGLCWRLFGFHPVVTRLAMAAVAGAAVYALLLLAGTAVSAAGGLWAAGITIVCPVFFSQSTMAQLDVPATLGVLLAVHFYLRRRMIACAVAGTLLCLTRETGAIIMMALAAYELFGRIPEAPAGAVQPRRKAPGEADASGFAHSPRAARHIFLLLLPLLPLAAWFVYLRLKTGLWLGDAEFAAYNVWGVLNPVRWLMQAVKRAYQLFVSDFRWIPTALVLAGARFAPLPAQLRRVFWLLIAVYGGFLSIFGGAPLTRYLLPLFPLLFLMAAGAVFQLRRRFHRVAIVWAVPALFVVCWFWNPPYPFAYEDNLAYADFVRLQQAADRMLWNYSGPTRVLTAWPATDELTRPWLGYVDAPRTVVPLPDFSREALDSVRPDSFDVLLIYSRQWAPEWFYRHPALTRLQARYFGYRPQVPSSEFGKRLGLRLALRTEMRGQWVEIWVKTLTNPNLDFSKPQKL